MSRLERLSGVLELLAESGAVDVDDLVEQLGVSPATARRDLDVLAKQQLLTRTRGGAVAHSIAYDLPMRYKHQQHPEMKVAIARSASALVPRGASVGLCGGTTTRAIADALMHRDDIMAPSDTPGVTIVTNAVNIAAELAVRPQIKTMLTGGLMQSRSYELVGSLADPVLDAVTLDFAFIGANGLDPIAGPTTHDEQEAHLNARFAARATIAVLVVDSSKIDKRSFATVGEPGLFTRLITDSRVTDDQRSRLEGAGYQVTVAPVGDP